MSGPTDDALLAILADLRGSQAYIEGYASADLVQRMLRRDGVDATIVIVGRRLSRLAREGRIEKRYSNGAGQYRLPGGRQTP